MVANTQHSRVLISFVSYRQRRDYNISMVMLNWRQMCNVNGSLHFLPIFAPSPADAVLAFEGFQCENDEVNSNGQSLLVLTSTPWRRRWSVNSHYTHMKYRCKNRIARIYRARTGSRIESIFIRWKPFVAQCDCETYIQNKTSTHCVGRRRT